MATSNPAGRGDDTHAYLIRGACPVAGTLTPGGNKNAALPMLAAALLGEHAVRLRNVPAIRDVHDMIRLIRSLGAEVRELEDGAWEVDTDNGRRTTAYRQQATGDRQPASGKGKI